MAGKKLGDKIMDNGLSYIKARIAASDNIDALLLKNWVYADTYAGLAAKTLGKYDMVVGTVGDPATDGQSPSGRQITINGFTIAATTASATGSDDLHVAIVNVTTSEILAVNDVSNDQAITAPNPVDITAYTIRIAQATQP